MMQALCVRNYQEPEINRKEILRYAGVRGQLPELEPLLESCLEEIRGKLGYKVCYREFPLVYYGGSLDLGFMRTDSQALKQNLQGCGSLLVFAATVGLAPDRLTARYGGLSPTKALLFQAIGAERIESLCEVFEQEVRAEKAAAGCGIRPRFSPGYGDFPLEAQREIFRVLDCPRQIGLSLNESLLMSPSKSVTACIGVSSEGCGEEKTEKCAACTRVDCAYRSME